MTDDPRTTAAGVEETEPGPRDSAPAQPVAPAGTGETQAQTDQQPSQPSAEEADGLAAAGAAEQAEAGADATQPASPAGADEPDDGEGQAAEAGAAKPGEGEEQAAEAGAAKPGEGEGQAAEPTSPAGAAEQAEGEEQAAEPAGAAKPEVDWQDYALRTQADFENYKKLAAQRVQKAGRDGVRRLALELLPALDNFERALAAAEAEEADAEHHLTKGIRLVQQDLLSAIARAGIEPYSPKGEPFDPHRHEAVAQQPVEGAEPGTIVEVYQQGYRFGDDILRAAKVVVAA